MSDLIVIVYRSEAKAEEVRERLFQLQKEYLIELEDAVIATRTSDGRVRLNQLIAPTLAGATTGSLWGLLIGAVFLAPVMVASAGAVGVLLAAASGAAVGAATGAVSGALANFGIDENFITQLADNIEPGNAALFLLVRKITADKVLDAIRSYGGVVLKTSLDRSKEQTLREALSAAATSAQTDGTSTPRSQTAAATTARPA